MKHHIYILIGLLMGYAFLTSCSEQNPSSLTPNLHIGEAESITRNTAFLKGSIIQTGNEELTTLRLRYGDTADMSGSIDFPARYGEVSDTLKGLKAGTQYNYYLEAGNSESHVQSNTHSFTTLPNNAPTLSRIKMISQGPLSIILKYGIKDNGGEAVISSGVYYKATDGTEQKLPAGTISGDSATIRIGNLKSYTAYYVQPYAANSVGEARGETFSFETGSATIVTAAGMLTDIIGENDKYNYTSIAIMGPLNGTDLRLLRDMAGRDITDSETQGRLTIIDLSDATIVRGGTNYNSARYSANDTIGYGLFKNCTRLQKLILPDNTKVIEGNALIGCSGLTTLQIPATTSVILPSVGCNSLSTITVNAANTTYSSLDGVLYNKAITEIIWFPMGKNDAYSLPATITNLGKYAFMGSKLSSFVLPNTIKTVPYAIFQDCTNLTSVTLGSATELLSSYCFQGCPLKELHVKATLPPFTYSDSFGGVNNIFGTCTLYIPKGSLLQYLSSSNWSKFQKIVEE